MHDHCAKILDSIDEGTHHIQSILVISPHSGAVKVTGLIVDEVATETGVIVVVYSLTDDHDVVWKQQQRKQQQRCH